MELRHLRYFLALADDSEVSRAARHCGLSSSVFLKHITDLEESLGCSLFRRHGSAHLSLSAAGQVFYDRAKDLLASAAAAAGEVRAAAAALASQVKLGHSARWTLDRYAAATRRFSTDYPAVRLHPLELPPSEMVGALRRGEIDIALVEHVDVGMRIEFKIRRIEAFPAYIAVPSDHCLAGKNKVSLRELSSEVWVSWDETLYPGRRALLTETAKHSGFEPIIAQDIDSDFAMYDAVAGGEAISYLGHAPSEEMPRGVTLVHLQPAVIEFPLFVAWRKDAENLEQLESLAANILGCVGHKQNSSGTSR